jgi:hypothetical protein
VKTIPDKEEHVDGRYESEEERLDAMARQALDAHLEAEDEHRFCAREEA